jgi:hypothetical protein
LFRSARYQISGPTRKILNLLTTAKMIMKIIDIKRKTKTEKRYSKVMGELTAKVTYIEKRFLGLRIKTLHKYRETYYGEIKNCDDCVI